MGSRHSSAILKTVLKSAFILTLTGAAVLGSQTNGIKRMPNQTAVFQVNWTRSRHHMGILLINISKTLRRTTRQTPIRRLRYSITHS